MAAPRADYGIDAPTAVRNLTVGGIAGIVAGIVVYAMMVPLRPVTGAILSIAGFISGFCLPSYGRINGMEQQIRETP